MAQYVWFLIFKNLIRKPYPIQKKSIIMQELEGFRYSSALYLNIDYYTIRLDPASQDMCTIITSWGENNHLILPMWVMCAPDIFQEECQTLWKI